MPQWNIPVSFPALEPDCAHVWFVSLDLSIEQSRRLTRMLTADERARSERYHFERDRSRFAVGRAYLRGFLGRYCGLPPSSLRLGANSFGKPFLHNAHPSPDLRFNLAHSGGGALFAFTLSREIGVDLEQIRPGVDLLAIARRFFSADEYGALQRVPTAEREDAFFRCWTRKEAYIKARGEGLSIPLDSFSVSLVPGRPAALTAHRNDPEELERWTMTDVSPRPDMRGALVVEGRSISILRWQATPESVFLPLP